MDKKSLRIVFMGTPEFATASLDILVESGYNVVGVVTMPDKPGGRGYKIQYSAVKKYALEKGLPLLQPEKLKDESFLKELKGWRADLQIVVAFRMLPEVVWNMPLLGTFNLHASLLPQYRGAAPINWSIINGEKETGVTTFFLTHEIDTGKIILQQKIPIRENDTAGDIHDKLMQVGAEVVKQTVDLILENKAEPISQEQLFSEDAVLKPAPKIFKETCRIDWNRSPENIHNFVRGLSPYPGAWTELFLPGKEPLLIKIYSSKEIKEENAFSPGTIITDNKTFLKAALSGGFLQVEEIQVAGKRTMKAEEFLRGFKVEEGAFFK